VEDASFKISLGQSDCAAIRNGIIFNNKKGPFSILYSEMYFYGPINVRKISGIRSQEKARGWFGWKLLSGANINSSIQSFLHELPGFLI